MSLHLGLGFGINEMAIMSAHYLWVLPIAMAYMLKRLSERYRHRLTMLLALLALYLMAWNGILIVEYLFWN
jgi:hypothetical protein